MPVELAGKQGSCMFLSGSSRQAWGAHLHRRVERGIKACAAVALLHGQPWLAWRPVNWEHFSPGPKLSPKRKTEVSTQIYSGKDLLWALCVCVFQADKKIDKYTARCVSYLEDFCLRCLIRRDAKICFLLPFVWSPVSLNRHCLYYC